MARNPLSTAKAVPTKKVEQKQKSAKLPSPLHPPYLQMIKEAICALKERTGSSQPAIAKYIEEKYSTNLSPNFKKILSVQLKKFAKSEKLVKVKNSFKISAPEKTKKVVSSTKEEKPAKKEEKTKAPRKVAGEKKQNTVTGAGVKDKIKTKRLSQVSTPKELKKKKKSLTPKKATKSIKKSPKPKPVTKRGKKA
ncbi:histone H1-II-like [Aristolochia californica]|uniref:histone H1-II-like n=1 Tax=Aristolochia californica TaxID=171875 RepID=UPI0035E39904